MDEQINDRYIDIDSDSDPVPIGHRGLEMVRQAMIEKKPHFIERFFDGLWDQFAAATEWLKDVVDTQPWTHVFLGISLWFVIVWLKQQSFLFHLAWMPWAWHWMVIVGAPFRIGSRY